MLLCSSFGCTAPPPREPAATQTVSDQEQIQGLLARFEEGVQKDDVSLLMSLYSPRLTPEERQEEQKRLEGAVRSFRYSEFHFSDPPVLPPGSLNAGKVALELRFVKPGGHVGDDVFSFRREDGKWYLVSVGLERPDKGDHVDLQDQERDQIVKAVSRCNQAILSGDMDALTAALAADMPPSARAKTKEDLVELLNLHKYQYFSSSFSRSALEVEFASKGMVAVPLDFMYVRHDGTRGERKLQFRFQRFGEEWQLIDIERRDSKFWNAFGKIAVPLIIQGASQAGRMAF